MAERTRYVNTASTAGGDGTTNATAGANRAYATLSEAVSGEAADLVTATDNLVIYFDGSGSIGTVGTSGEWAGYTTSTTYDIYIGPIDNDVRAGTSWDSGKTKITGGAWSNAFNIPNTVSVNVTLEGLQISIPGTGNEICIATSEISGTPTLNLIGNLCIALSSKTNTNPVVSLQANHIRGDVINNIIINESTTGVRALLETYTAGELVVYNNTLVGEVGANATDAALSFRHSGSMARPTYIKNNILDGGSNVGYNWDLTTGPTATDANLTNDASSPDGASFQNKTATFVSSTNWALDSSDTNALGQGVNLYSDSEYAVTTDILGTTRPQGSNFDIGAHEYIIAAAGFPYHAVKKHFRMMQALLAM